MLTGSVSLIGRLGWRLRRGRWGRRSAIPAALAVAILTASYLSLQALTLSDGQKVEQELGSAPSMADLTGVVVVRPGEAPKVAAGNTITELFSVDIRSPFASTAYAPFIERPWSAKSYPARYQLQRGVWPRAANDVVVTNPTRSQARIGAEISVLSGNLRLRVVGVARDRYARFSSLLAAPGTWESLQPRRVSDFTLEASPRLYFPRDNFESNARAVVRFAGNNGYRLRMDQARDLLATRATLADDGTQSWSRRVPAGYTIPALVLPLLIGLFPFALFSRDLGRVVSRLSALGIPRRVAALSSASTLAIWLTLGALVGSLAGLVGAAAIRPILGAEHDLPLAPMSAPWLPGLRAIPLLWVACLLGAIQLGRRPTGWRQSVVRTATRSTRANTVRHVAAAVVVGALVVQVTGIDSPERIMFFAGTIAVLAALLASDIAAVVLKRLDRGQLAPARRLAIRQLAGDGRRLGVAVGTLAVVLGLPVAFLSLVATMTATSKDAAVPDVRPGQVAVSGVGGQLTSASASVSRVTRGLLERNHQPVQLRYLGTEQLPLAAGAGGYGFVALFDTPDDVATFFPDGLSAAARSTVQRGGVLSWDSAAATRQLRWKPTLPAVTVPNRQIERPRTAWGTSTVTVGLTSSARRWGLPTTPGAVFYNEVSRGEAHDIRAALVAHGLDADQMTSYTAPRPPLAPIAYVLVIGLLLVLAFAASYSVMRLQGDALRRHLAMTSALGLPAAWCRRVLLIQFVLILGVGTVLAGGVGVLPVVVGAWKLDGFVLDIPVPQLLGLVLAVYLVSFAALYMASRQIRPTRIAI